MKRFTIARHPPLITHRIQFHKVLSSNLTPPSARPQITHRIDFGEEQHDVTKGPDANLTRAAPPLLPRVSADGPVFDQYQSADVDVGAPSQANGPDDYSDSQEELDELPDDSDSPEASAKIPKPAGEAGKPNSGGYTLEDELQGWTEKFYGEVTKFVKAKANASLDTNVSYTGQTQAAISAVCHQVRRRYPVLAKYEGDWPTRDMLKAHLKYTSERFRKNAGVGKGAGTTNEAPKHVLRLRRGRKGA